MELGLIFFAAGESSTRRDSYRLVIESSRFADRNGFSSVFVPERHFTEEGCLFPNPAILHAALARETDGIQLRAGSIVLPLHDPIRVAEEWSMVDNLSNGRVGVSVASGWHPNDLRSRPPRLRRPARRNGSQSRGRPASMARGTHHPPRGRRRCQRPFAFTRHRYTAGLLPSWITAAGSPETFALAGRLGVHLLTHLFNQDHAELASADRHLPPGARRPRAADPASGMCQRDAPHLRVGRRESFARAEAEKAFRKIPPVGLPSSRGHRQESRAIRRPGAARPEGARRLPRLCDRPSDLERACPVWYARAVRRRRRAPRAARRRRDRDPGGLRRRNRSRASTLALHGPPERALPRADPSRGDSRAPSRQSPSTSGDPRRSTRDDRLEAGARA